MNTFDKKTVENRRKFVSINLSRRWYGIIKLHKINPVIQNGTVNKKKTRTSNK